MLAGKSVCMTFAYLNFVSVIYCLSIELDSNCAEYCAVQDFVIAKYQNPPFWIFE